MMNLKISAYHNVWLDNGVENLYRILNNVESCRVKLCKDSLTIEILNQKKFVKSLTKEVLHRKQNLIVIEEDKKTTARKEFKKDYILIQEGKKVGGKVILKEEIYKSEKTADIISRIFDSDKGKNTCILCERKYNRSVKKLQQANYPFVTKIASLSGVRSYKDGKGLSLSEYYRNLCPLCYLIGVLEWVDEGLVYRTFPREKSFLFMPYFNNLLDLHKFKKLCIYSGVLNNFERYSNIKTGLNIKNVEHTPGKYSTLLCFYEKFVENATDEMIASDWVILHIPLGSVKNVKSDFLSIDRGILGVIKNLKEQGKLERIYSDLIKKIRFYSQEKRGTDWDTTREIQENSSKFFLLDDFRKFIHSLLPRRGGYIFFSSEVKQYLNELIFNWRWKNMGIAKEKMDAIKSVGNIIAKISKNNVSLLYKLDKVRSVEEFWTVLREISKKLIGLNDEDLKMTKPKALDEIILLTKDIVTRSKDKWKEVRDLIIIYASMYYSLDKLKKTSKGGEKK